MPTVPLLHRRCAWCLRDLGSMPCELALAGQISHGLCSACEAAIIASIAAAPIAPARAA